MKSSTLSALFIVLLSVHTYAKEAEKFNTRPIHGGNTNWKLSKQNLVPINTQMNDKPKAAEIRDIKFNLNNRKSLELLTNFQTVRNWTSCVYNIPYLNSACVVLYVDNDTLTIGAKLIIHNVTVLQEKFTGSEICVGEAELLELLILIPALAPFAAIIKKIAQMEKKLPAHIFSICLKLTNLTVTGNEFAGCAELDTTLLCYEKSCVYKGSVSFGCFDIKKQRKL